MRNRVYYDALPEHIKKQFKIAREEQHYQDVDIYLHKEGESREFIDDAFEWSKTKEDHDYWAEINELFKNDGSPAPEDFEYIYKNYPEHSKRDEVINNYPIY